MSVSVKGGGSPSKTGGGSSSSSVNTASSSSSKLGHNNLSRLTTSAAQLLEIAPSYSDVDTAGVRKFVVILTPFYFFELTISYNFSI